MKRVFQEDQLKTSYETDIVGNFMTIGEQHSPDGFKCRKSNDAIIFYNLVFDEETQFPTVLETIKVDRELHVQLQYNGNPIPLPPWFVQGHNAKLTRLSMLENLPSYIRNVASETQYSLLDEIKNRKHYKAKGRLPYSAAMLRYALHLSYTSAQCYKLLLEKFPLPSISLLNKLQQGGVDSVKAIKMLREKREISDDIILMVDEMYLQNSTQYQSSEYVGADEDGNLYKGVVAFMLVGLKKSR